MIDNEFDCKPRTEREVLIARSAYLDGTLYSHHSHSSESHARALESELAKRYPLPKVTRRRVLPDPVDPAVEWAVIDGRLAVRYRQLQSPWEREPQRTIMPERVAMWADLLARPTEECEAES